MTVRAVLPAALLIFTACGGGASPSSGRELAQDVGCLGCHTEESSSVAPTLHRIWGSKVTLEDGRSVTVDEDYVRESITQPQADIVEGYGPVMPTFPLDDSEVDRLVDWVESLG